MTAPNYPNFSIGTLIHIFVTAASRDLKFGTQVKNIPWKERSQGQVTVLELYTL